VTEHNRRIPRPRLLVALAVLVGGPIILYHILRIAGVPAALVSGVVVIVALKHIGLLAVLVTPLYALLRRRSGR
jgi:hypothetical protein